MESEVKEYLNVYLKNKLAVVKMLNPKGKGAKFGSRNGGVGRRFMKISVKSLKKKFDVEEDRMSFSCYYQFYKTEYDTFGKFSDKTWYCGT